MHCLTAAAHHGPYIQLSCGSLRVKKCLLHDYVDSNCVEYWLEKIVCSARMRDRCFLGGRGLIGERGSEVGGGVWGGGIWWGGLGKKSKQLTRCSQNHKNRLHSEYISEALTVCQGGEVALQFFPANRPFFVSERAIRSWKRVMRSWSLFSKEAREWFAHGHSFVKSVESEWLMIALS